MNRIPALLSVVVVVSRRVEVSLLAVALAVVLGVHTWIGVQTGFLPCRMDCGENYEGYIQARNLFRFGWRSAGGLPDLAANPEPAAHPMMYTHNANLTSVPFLLALFALGVQDIHAQMPWVTVPFLLGLAYLYVAIKVVSGDAMLAGLCLLNAAGLYLLVELWGFHVHRVWSWLLTWGVTYHVVKWSRA